MNILAHQRKVVRFIECDGFPIFGEEARKSASQTDDSQLRINKLLGIDEATFLKHFKDDSASDIDEVQARINKMLNIDPLTFKKYFG